jgi:ribosomal protein L31
MAESLAVDVCSNCHPVYTGHEHALADSSRIARFDQRHALACG